MLSSKLYKKFMKMDLFDQCPQAIQKVNQLKANYPNFGYAEVSSMEYFRWRFLYSAIFMVWCVGYLNRAELVSFLRKAKAQLLQSQRRSSRSSTPQSFIFVLDNILGPEEAPVVHKGQKVRTQEELNSIFVEAGLIIYKRSALEEMPGIFQNVCVWALY